MASKSPPPDFKEFTRWVRNKVDAASVSPLAAEKFLSAARVARDHAVSARLGNIEILQLLAAASDESSRPPELMTAKGFRVTLAYDDGTAAEQPSICVLVQCPPDQVAQVQGQTAYLWSGSERFELGQFDADGKAIGTLPAGIQITLSDFTAGTVKLEAPGASDS